MKLACIVLGSVVSVFAQPPAAQALFNRYCAGCHNEQARAGGFSLQGPLSPTVSERALRQLNHRHMPPVGLPRPSDATYNLVVKELAASLDADAARHPHAGRPGTFRRLNRLEYHNAIRDLLAVDYNVTTLLPADETSHGFDNIAVENLSPILIERYLSAAQKISRLALGSPVRKPSSELIMIPPDLTQEEHVPGLPHGTRGGAIATHTFPVSAQYQIQVRLSRDRDERVEGLDQPHRVELTLDGTRLGLFTVTPPPRGQDHQNVDQHLTVKLAVAAGPHQLGVSFPRKTAALLETGRQPYQAHFNMDRHPRVQPALYSISIIGPFDPTGPGDSPSRRRIFVCAEQTDACANQILTTLLRRAYRRPIQPSDLIAPLDFYRKAKAEGGFDNGIEMALRALLVNPQFLFRIEKDPAPSTRAPYPLSGPELASRLSFFLWSTIPDDTLLDLAERDKLKDPVILEQQVRRMLADPRSESLVTNFAAQWLYLRNLAGITPDPRLFPDFDENLRQSMQRETELFFASVLHEDQPVPTLLKAPYTFLNERLARHYGIPHIYGSRFRRVDLTAQPSRGGLLSHASILTVTSYATRTSPVIRGKWILANILGTPPSAPPPAVPELKEAVRTPGAKSLSMRERVAEHRKNPACAGCHNLMDPIGFAFENYDAVGRWRSSEGGNPVDASGALPDGTKFQNAAELNQALLQRPELFVSALTEKLLIYALGRGIERYDAPAIRKIVREAEKKDYRLSSLLLGIATSTPFTMRQSQ